MMKRMTHQSKALCFVVLALSILAVACGGDESEGSEGPESSGGPVQVIVNTPGGATQRVRRTPTPSPVPTASPLVVCAPNPDPASPKALQVQEPIPNQQVRVPVHVRGWGSTVGEKGVALSVVDQKQSVVQTNNLPALPREFRAAPRGLDLTDHTRPFAADVVVNVTEPTPYCLWVYQETTSTGRARGVIQIPVIILPPE
jgi:hypothetical protein